MEVLQELECLVACQSSPSASAAAVLLGFGVPATSIALLSGDKITSKQISTTPINSETLFQACSISKPIAAVAIFRAVQAGYLSLTTPITMYLSPQQIGLLETPTTEHLLQDVTIEMLLSHTSGLSQGHFSGYTHNPPHISTILKGVYPSNTPQVHLEAFPGQRFQYSGGGFTVLQMILETAFNKPFPTIMQDLVLDPLNMRRSCYVLDRGTVSNFAGAHVTGQTAHEPAYHLLPELAAAGLWTTPSELLVVIRALQLSLNGTDESFLKQEWARLMLTEIQSQMARGWGTPAGSGVFGHSGANDPGYRCQLIGWADIAGEGKVDLGKAEGCGICVMTNSQLGIEIVGKMIHATSYLMGWPEIPTAGAVDTSVTPFAAPGGVTDGWQQWKGYWGEKWQLLGHESPMLKFGYLPTTRLLRAAIAPRRDGEFTSIDLVVEGLEIMLRLRWEDGEQIMEIRSGREEEGKILHRI